MHAGACNKIGESRCEWRKTKKVWSLWAPGMWKFKDWLGRKWFSLESASQPLPHTDGACEYWMLGTKSGFLTNTWCVEQRRHKLAQITVMCVSDQLELCWLMQFNTLPLHLLLQQRLKWVFIELRILLLTRQKWDSWIQKAKRHPECAIEVPVNFSWMHYKSPVWFASCFWLVNRFRIYGQCTHHGLKKHCVAPLQSGNKQNELQEAQSRETFGWNILWLTIRDWCVQNALPCAPVSDNKTRVRMGGVGSGRRNQAAHASNGRKMRWQKRENIHKLVLKFFIEVILVQSISDVLENP